MGLGNGSITIGFGFALACLLWVLRILTVALGILLNHLVGGSGHAQSAEVVVLLGGLDAVWVVTTLQHLLLAAGEDGLRSFLALLLDRCGAGGLLLGAGLAALGLGAEVADVGLVLLAHFGAVCVGLLISVTKLGEVLVEALLVLVVGEGGLGASKVDLALIFGALEGSGKHARLFDHRGLGVGGLVGLVLEAGPAGAGVFLLLLAFAFLCLDVVLVEHGDALVNYEVSFFLLAGLVVELLLLFGRLGVGRDGLCLAGLLGAGLCGLGLSDLGGLFLVLVEESVEVRF